MGSPQAVTEPINPLTGDLQTVAVASREATDGTVDVQGRLFAPGLAITPNLSTKPDKPQRFNLTHLPTGLTVGRGCCGTHVQEVAAIAVDSGIDWTAGQEQVVAAIKASDGLGKQLSPWCDDWCDGDGPKPPIWQVRCNTCDWQLDDEDGEPALTATDAKYAADDHRCDPVVEIRHPETGKWHDEWLVSKDGSIRDLTRKG